MVVPTEQPVSEWGLAPMPYREPTESPDWGMAPMPYKEPTESPDWGMAPMPYKEPTESPDWGMAPMPYKEPTELPDWGMAPMPYKEPTESPALGALMVDSGEAALSQPYSPSPYDANFPMIYAGLALTTIIVVALLMLRFCRMRETDHSDKPFPKLYKLGTN